MTATGTDSGNALGAGAKNCWQYFGFDGPTDKDDLETAYREKLNNVGSSLYPPWTTVYTFDQYKECLDMIDGEDTKAAQLEQAVA